MYIYRERERAVIRAVGEAPPRRGWCGARHGSRSWRRRARTPRRRPSSLRSAHRSVDQWTGFATWEFKPP